MKLLTLHFAESRALERTELKKPGLLLLLLRLQKLAAALMVVLSIAMTQVANAEPFSELFGYPAAPQGNASDFPKWISVLEQSREEQSEIDCDDITPCIAADWQDLITDLQGQKPDEQLQAVNRFVNAQSYVVDEANYGEADVWATPLQFLENGGDCEDFAILKMFSLLKLGWSPSALRLVIVQDTKLKMPHAVLAVAVGADVWVLDNQSNRLKRNGTIAHYAPVYSLSQAQWWLHSPRLDTVGDRLVATSPASR